MTPFWQTKPLQALSPSEWESLCDGCGKCCLHKLEDEDDGQVYYTQVACRYLNTQTARCSTYGERKKKVAACITLTPETLHQYPWLPSSCAYKRLAQGQPLPDWHPLITGNPASVKTAGQSVAGRVLSAAKVPSRYHQDHVIHWVDTP